MDIDLININNFHFFKFNINSISFLSKIVLDDLIL